MPSEFGLEGVHRVVSALLIAGFPLALVLAWLYDLSATGIHLTRAPGGESAETGGLKPIHIVSLTVTIVLSGFIGWFLLTR